MTQSNNNEAGSPNRRWTVTQVQAQLDELAGACNELERAGEAIRFIVPLPPSPSAWQERPVSCVVIFSVRLPSTLENVTEG